MTMADGGDKLQLVRKVALRLLQVLGFLQQENVIHADLKPENVLCRTEDLSSGVKVIDFGNAIHCVYDELSLYYDDFELQTLLYRAPEVVYGLPFGPEIDMWSLGCILAELYLGEPLFFAVTKEELLQKMVAVLGPLPIQVFQRGKFYPEYEGFIGKKQSMLETQGKLFRRLGNLQDYNFGSFIQSILQYNPSERITVSDAFLHPFLAPEVAARFLLPPSSKVGTSFYNKINISASTYTLSPAISTEIAADHLNSVELLRRGTTSLQPEPVPAKRPKRAVAEVAPFTPKQDLRGSQVVRVPVCGRVPADAIPSERCENLLKQEPQDFVEIHSISMIAHSRATSIPEVSPALPNSSLKDQCHGQSTSQPALTEYTSKQGHYDNPREESGAFYGNEFTNQKRSGCAVIELPSTTKSKSFDQDLIAMTVRGPQHTDPEDPQLTHKNEPDAANTRCGVDTEDKSLPTPLASEEGLREPPFKISFSSSPSGMNEICIGNLKGHVERTIEGEYQRLEGLSQRPFVPRLKHLERMKMDTLKQDLEQSLDLTGGSTEWYRKSFAERSSCLGTQSNQTKSAIKVIKPSKNDSPERACTVTRKIPPSTLSNPQEDVGDGLNLLTPLSHSQTPGSYSKQSQKNVEITPKRTPTTLRRGATVRRKISASIKVEKTSSGLKALSVKKSKQQTEAKLLPSSVPDKSDKNQILKSQTLNGGQTAQTRRKLNRNKNSLHRALKKDNDDPDNSISVKGPETNQHLKEEPVLCKGTEEDEAVGKGKVTKNSNPTESWSSPSQATAITLTPRSSARRSKTRAQERIRCRLVNQEPCQWWEVNPRGDGIQGGDSYQDAEYGYSEGTRIAEVLHKGPLGTNCDSEHQAKAKRKNNKECRLLDKNPNARMSLEIPKNLARVNVPRNTAGLMDSEKKELAENVYKFENSPNSGASLQSRKLKNVLNVGLKYRRTAQRNLGKQGPTKDAGKKNVSSSQRQRTLKWKKSGSLRNVTKRQANLESDAQRESPELKVKSKHAVVTRLQSAYDGNNIQHIHGEPIMLRVEDDSPRPSLSKKRKVELSLGGGDDEMKDARHVQEVLSAEDCCVGITQSPTSESCAKTKGVCATSPGKHSNQISPSRGSQPEMSTSRSQCSPIPMSQSSEEEDDEVLLL